MKKNRLVIVIAALILILCSCQDDCSKADKLLLQNRFEEAVELYQKAADQGNAYAKWRLYGAYVNGDGVEFDESRAVQLLKEAAEGGCEEAKCDLAYAYIFDWFSDIEKDADKGKHMLDELVKKTDNSYVLSRYAALLFFGESPYEEDKEKAMSILEKVKDKNNRMYLATMGEVYLNGTDNMDIDKEKAADYFEKAFNQGRRFCAARLYAIYSSEPDKSKMNIQKMIEWLERGVESNETTCMTEYSNLCLSEDTLFKDIHNPQKAIELLKKATKHGDGDAYAMLGHHYFNGQYLPKDDEKAFECFEKAYKLKSDEGAFSLGWAYINGCGCEKNIPKGIEIWKRAVEYGNGGAANNLFCYFNQGDFGGKIDKEQAKIYLKKAAELGNVMGCLNLGREYFLGNNLMKKDDSQAFVYIKMAADMGNVDACGVLSYFYENGIGCNKDPEKAKEYRDKTVAKEDKKEE